MPERPFFGVEVFNGPLDPGPVLIDRDRLPTDRPRHEQGINTQDEIEKQ